MENEKRILIACEFSGRVREAFKSRGWDAWSCDLLDTEIPGQHIKDDVLKHLDEDWDIMIAHPPCTHLSNSGQRWFTEGKKDYSLQKEAIAFAEALWKAPIPKIAIENPVGVLPNRSILGKSTQVINPWQFGDAENKRTCLWLKNLPKLIPTQIIPVEQRKNSVLLAPPSNHRWMDRSRTFHGIANAMAEQWGVRNGTKKI